MTPFWHTIYHSIKSYIVQWPMSQVATCDTSSVTGNHLWHGSLNNIRFYTVIYWRGYFTVDIVPHFFTSLRFLPFFYQMFLCCIVWERMKLSGLWCKADWGAKGVSWGCCLPDFPRDSQTSLFQVQLEWMDAISPVVRLRRRTGLGPTSIGSYFPPGLLSSSNIYFMSSIFSE